MAGASSQLKQKTKVMEWSGEKPVWRAASFGPESAVDGTLATAWCEGAPGIGTGEWIEVELAHPVRALGLAMGFRKLSLAEPEEVKVQEAQARSWFEQSLRTFRNNGRPAVLELTATSGGSAVERVGYTCAPAR